MQKGRENFYIKEKIAQTNHSRVKTHKSQLEDPIYRQKRTIVKGQPSAASLYRRSDSLAVPLRKYALTFCDIDYQSTGIHKSENKWQSSRKVK